MNERFVTALSRPVECDVEKRRLLNAIFATTGLASDGAIILPTGINLARFRQSPVITESHISVPGISPSTPKEPAVVANADNLVVGDMEMGAEVQFADTQAGRDYAYLYGCNPARQAFMRAWSVEGSITDSQKVPFAVARKIAGPYWDDGLAERIQKRKNSVLVGIAFELRNVAVAVVGADRGALTRAHKDGVETAGELVARMDLDLAGMELADLKRKQQESDERMVRLEQDIQALRSEGASAAARGDSEAILNEVRELLKVAGQNTARETQQTER